jgi:hypothetical protein
MVLVRGHNLNKPFESFVTEDGQELARVRSDVLVLTQRERNDCGAVLVGALADEWHRLLLICAVLFGLGVDLLVRVTKDPVVASDAFLGPRIYLTPALPNESGERMSTAEFASR